MAADEGEEPLEAGLEPLERVTRAPLRCGMLATVSGMGMQQVTRHRRHQRARQDEGADEGEHDRLGQRPEQIAGDAAKLEHRRENDVEHQERHERRYDDLLRAVEDRWLDRLAHLQMVENVFQRNRSLVDQHADGKRQPAERHHVDGFAECGETDDGKQHREGDGDDDDDRRAPAAEE